MAKRLFLSFLCLLPAFVAAVQASAQRGPQAPAAVAAPPVQEDQEAKPEPPKIVLNVEVKNDLLSVELENVDFGTAIRAVADKAAFTIEGTGEVFSRKLNTRFMDLDIERGVLRLLTLVKESNYMLHYDTKGLISKLEIFGIGSVKAPAVATKQPLRPTPALRQPVAAPDLPQIQRPTTASPAPQTRPVPPVLRRRPVISRPATPSQPAMPQSSEEADQEEESVNEIPYVAPQPRFAPAPAR